MTQLRGQDTSQHSLSLAFDGNTYDYRQWEKPIDWSVTAFNPDWNTGLNQNDHFSDWLNDGFDFGVDFGADDLRGTQQAEAAQERQEHRHPRGAERESICDKNYRSTEIVETGSSHFGSASGFRCDLCAETFTKKKTLKRHTATVHQAASHQCSQCGKSFKRFDSLKRHINEQHGDSHQQQVSGKHAGKIECPVCGSKVRPSGLIDHQKSKSCRSAERATLQFQGGENRDVAARAGRAVSSSPEDSLVGSGSPTVPTAEPQTSSVFATNVPVTQETYSAAHRSDGKSEPGAMWSNNDWLDTQLVEHEWSITEPTTHLPMPQASARDLTSPSHHTDRHASHIQMEINTNDIEESSERVLSGAVVDYSHHMPVSPVSPATNPEDEMQADTPSLNEVSAELCNAVLSGKWSEAERVLTDRMSAVQIQTASLTFKIRRQKYLELLEKADKISALRLLTTETADSEQGGVLWVQLASLLACHSADELYEKAKWDGAVGRSRRLLLAELMRSLDTPASVEQTELYHAAPASLEGESQNAVNADKAVPSDDVPKTTTTDTDRSKPAVQSGNHTANATALPWQNLSMSELRRGRPRSDAVISQEKLETTFASDTAPSEPAASSEGSPPIEALIQTRLTEILLPAHIKRSRQWYRDYVYLKEKVMRGAWREAESIVLGTGPYIMPKRDGLPLAPGVHASSLRFLLREQLYLELLLLGDTDAALSVLRHELPLLTNDTARLQSLSSKLPGQLPPKDGVEAQWYGARGGGSRAVPLASITKKLSPFLVEIPKGEQNIGLSDMRIREPVVEVLVGTLPTPKSLDTRLGGQLHPVVCQGWESQPADDADITVGHLIRGDHEVLNQDRADLQLEIERWKEGRRKMAVARPGPGRNRAKAATVYELDRATQLLECE